MWPIATDVVAWSVYVCLLGTTMSPTKVAEPIVVPFGIWTRVGPRNHGLSGDGAILGDIFQPVVE